MESAGVALQAISRAEGGDLEAHLADDLATAAWGGCDRRLSAQDGPLKERFGAGGEFKMSRKVVWRSDGNSPCGGCGQLPGHCRCSAASPSAVPTGPARIRIEKRRGKTVTVVDEIPLVEKDVKALLRDLKKRLASGGTCKQNTIELQGDHVDGVRKWFEGHSIPHRGWH